METWKKYPQLYRYNNEKVRDLAASIVTPNIIKSSNDGIVIQNDVWFEDSYFRLENTLLKLDADPSELVSFLEKTKSTRLGLYFENLLFYWFQIDERFSVLEFNKQIFEEKRTIGAFDFIIQDEENNKTIHLEVAVKFYLKKKSSPELSSFFGPVGTDRFDKKYRYLLEHQIKISDHQESLKYLSENSINVDGKWIIFKGILFFEIDEFEKDQSLDMYNNFCLKAWFCDLSKFLNKFESSTYSWLVIAKKQWLSPVLSIDEVPYSVYSWTEFCDYLNSQKTIFPLCVVALSEGKEVTRGFIL